MPVDHYENFPVASVLVPKAFRGPIEAIYWFARSADDIADEGDDPPSARLAVLDAYRGQLDAIERGAVVDGAEWTRLAGTIRAHGLPLQPFRDLLDAFAQDVVKTRYASFAEVESYCRRSANPVGRLLLRLFRADDERNLRESDAICTALQLINFCQDVAIDLRKDRVYIPLDELEEAGVTIDAIGRGVVDACWQRLFVQQLDRALALLERGKPLGSRLSGRFALELRAIVAGGERIGARLRATDGDVFRQRPTLKRSDWLTIGWRALVPSRTTPRVAFGDGQPK